eukprot:5968848-Prymnesium_polylepis.1
MEVAWDHDDLLTRARHLEHVRGRACRQARRGLSSVRGACGAAARVTPRERRCCAWQKRQRVRRLVWWANRGTRAASSTRERFVDNVADSALRHR